VFDFCIDFVFQSLKYSVAVHQRLVFTSIRGGVIQSCFT